MQILGGKRIVEGTGNFRKEWRIVGKTQTVGEPGNCGKKEKNQFSELLHCYRITSQMSSLKE